MGLDAGLSSLDFFYCEIRAFFGNPKYSPEEARVE